MKAIQAEPQSIDRIFDSHEFIIPDFQRPYSWEVEQCEQLWDDISSFISEQIDNEGKEKYFLGSIVVYPNDKNEHTWEIVDGQQRLTTLLILIRLLFAKASTHRVLQRLFYKTDPKTGEVVKEPRLESKVLAGDGRDDYRDFCKIMEMKTGEIPDTKNSYKSNTECLSEGLNNWWEKLTPDQRERALEIFQKDIVLLPIICKSIDDALTLFQIINDRGMRLSDADIFKARIYKMINENDRPSFVKRWSNLKDHEDLFRIHMHILRAKSGDAKKEIGLRRYMEGHFEKVPESEKPQEGNSIMRSLKCYHKARKDGALPSNVPECWQEKIYWEILRYYPNIYWWYPLHVFLNKYGTEENDRFFLADEQHSNYIELLKNTVRYFYIKGVVYNTVNRVRDTTFKVCVAIEKEEDYVDKYRENLGNDLESFKDELAGKISARYLRGLMLLNASLNSKQNMERLVGVVKSCHIEHILPYSWGNYDGWNQEIHGENIEKFGNKVLLEWRLNIKASNEFFARKQEDYKDSQIQDAADLSEYPALWYPGDVQKRQEIMLDRLNRFFSAIA